MKYCLDTNTCIYFLKGQFDSVRTRLQSLSPKAICIPAIVVAELRLGAKKSQRRSQTEQMVQEFLDPFDILPFGDAEASVYATIRAQLEREGNVIGPNDLLIAATAASSGGVLVTNNLREFSRVPGLQVENWVIAEVAT